MFLNKFVELCRSDSKGKPLGNILVDVRKIIAISKWNYGKENGGTTPDVYFWYVEGKSEYLFVDNENQHEENLKRIDDYLKNMQIE